jgi:hypothetical protein
MSGEELGSAETAPVVAVNDDQNELSLLRDLVGEKETPTGGAKGEERDPSSELSSPPDSSKDSDSEEEEEEEEEGKKEEKRDNGRPNFRRAEADVEALKSDREWFNRGRKEIGTPTTKNRKTTEAYGSKPHAEKGKETAEQFFARRKKEREGTPDGRGEDIFDTPGKLGGALAGVLSAARKKWEKVGTSLTLSMDDPPANGARGGAEEISGNEEMEVVDEDEWMAEAANISEGANGSAPPSPTPVTFETATPSQRRPPVSRPITPTRGRKRMAVGTPVPVRRYGHPHGTSLGTFTQTSLAEIEARLNSKLASLVIDAEAREARLHQRMNSLATG